ncbi:hypothetical protein [Shewanella baltica]|uniref:hypothetical protein n=1 Tax=Shewanella baltica TaxID=62322 RepID=UPI0028781054|nr:hypothetical protein [Shewanella baltica]
MSITKWNNILFRHISTKQIGVDIFRGGNDWEEETDKYLMVLIGQEAFIELKNIGRQS